MDEFFDTSAEDERRARLGRSAGQTAGTYNPKYSIFIRWAKLVLPLIALIITAVVFTWSVGDKNALPVIEEAKAPKTIGKNELLNPRFESMDEKKQPYTITAKRAVQGEKDEDLVLLEKPIADMLLNSGSWVAIEAQEGAFRQNNQQLLLTGNVRIFHDEGYQLEMAQLNIDMKENTAWSKDDVSGQGPAGTLKAKGLQADAKNGHLVFNGPATLVLNSKFIGHAGGGVKHE